MTDQRRTVCFEKDKGFMVYHPDDGSVTYTLDRMAASESQPEDWVDIGQFNLDTCTLMVDL